MFKIQKNRVSENNALADDKGVVSIGGDESFYRLEGAPPRLEVRANLPHPV
jgi:hypothetical protein